MTYPGSPPAGPLTVWHQHREIDGAHLYSVDEYDFEAEDGPLDQINVDEGWFATLPEDPGP